MWKLNSLTVKKDIANSVSLYLTIVDYFLASFRSHIAFPYEIRLLFTDFINHETPHTLSLIYLFSFLFVGSFAVWGTLFSICDCTFTYIRKKEDPWNAIASGAATGGLSKTFSAIM